MERGSMARRRKEGGEIVDDEEVGWKAEEMEPRSQEAEDRKKSEIIDDEAYVNRCIKTTS